MWSQALGPGEWEAWALLPHPHTSIYVQGHNDTDMYKYTQACTHAHKYTHTHTNMYHSIGSLCIPASLGEHPKGPQGGGISPFT